MVFKKSFFIIVLGACLAITSVGCDQLKNVKNKMTGDTKKVQPNVAPSMKNQSEPVVSKVPAMTPDTLARVGSWTITKEEFNERITALKEIMPEFDTTVPQNRADVLEELIRQQLVVLDAEQSGFSSKKEIKEAVEEFRRTLIVREIAVEKTKNITVSEDEARQLYEDNKAVLVEPLRLRVREIVVKEKEKAEELLIQILQGSDFVEIAKMHSITDSAENGGDLGYLEKVPFPQMGNQLVTLEEGGVSTAFSGPEGYYIVKVEEKSGGKPLEYNDIKDKIIEQQTLLKQQQIILEYVEGLRSEFEVEINEELLKN